MVEIQHPTAPFLATIPTVAVQLLHAASDPHCTIDSLQAIAKADPAVSARLLRVCRSPHYRMRLNPICLEQAAPLLGYEVAAAQTLSFALAPASMQSGTDNDRYCTYWRRALHTAAAAEVLCPRTSEARRSEYFVTGLLLDLGQLAALHTRRGPMDRQAVVHVTTGIMEGWCYPQAMIQAARSQYASVEELQIFREMRRGELVLAGAAAAALGDLLCDADGVPAAEARVEELFEKVLERRSSDIPDVLARVKSRVADFDVHISTPPEELPPLADVMAEAATHLASLVDREHQARQTTAARLRSVEQAARRLESKYSKLRRHSIRDPLTKVYNRQFFDEALAKETQRCSRDALPIGLIFADLDRFKVLNDTYGHQFGDLVLKRVARAFGDVLRQSDVVARYGGEEFVVLVNEPTEAGVAHLGERIRARIAEEEFTHEGRRIGVTISLGATIAVPDRSEIDLGERLVAVADEAMYEAKVGGRNQVRMHSLLDDLERRLSDLTAQRRFSRWLIAQSVLDFQAVASVLAECRPDHVRIGELARQLGYLDSTEVELILLEQQRTGERFSAVATRLQLLEQEQIVDLLAVQQEDARLLATLLVDRGLISETRMQELFARYQAQLPRDLPTRENEPLVEQLPASLA